MDALSPSDPCRDVVLKFSSQTGKTEVLNNFVGFIIDHDPGPCLIIQPNTKPMGEAYSKDRLAPMIRDTKCLREKVKEMAKIHKSDNTILHKTFPGGHLTVSGANSPAGLASRPIRYLLRDEVDRHYSTREGDSGQLARKRTLTFWNRKVLSVSSPTYKDDGIDAEYKQCERQYEWQLQCDHCGEWQYPTFKHIHFEERDLDSVVYVCATCGGIHEQGIEHRLKANGAWALTAEHGAHSKGFMCNQWGSPFASWRDTVAEFLAAKDDKEKLRVVTNTAFCETWDEKSEQVSHLDAMKRVEQYDAEVPAGVKVLTAGIDVQQDRIEYEVVGWGDGEESWSIDYRIVEGNTSQKFVWEDLNKLLRRGYTKTDDKKLTISAIAIDSGHLATYVYMFVRQFNFTHIWAVKGNNGHNKPIIEPRDKRLARLRATKAKKGRPEYVGVDGAKNVFYERLILQRQKDGTYPTGYCHFPAGRDEEYFKQLCSERKVEGKLHGRKIHRWEQTRIRNEALDCRIYAHAALLLYAQSLSHPWDKKPERREETKPQQPTVTQQLRRRRPQGRGGFVNGWK